MARWWTMIVETAAALLTPLSPTYWWPAARMLAKGNLGWEPPMLLWAILGVVLPLNFGFGRGVPWLEHFNLITWATWSIVALLAMAVTIGQAAYAIVRLGLEGVLRPRCWFELGRVSCVLATICFVTGMFLAIALNQQQRQLVAHVFPILAVVTKIAVPGFFIGAAMGYLLSFVRRKPRVGRAFGCVQFFLTISGPLLPIFYAIEKWPAAGNWQACIVPGIIGSAGIGWMLFGLVSVLVRCQRIEQTRGWIFPDQGVGDEMA